jgi:HK97 family phage major capsid protein
MQKRDELVAEFNQLAARAADLRSTDTGAEELITVTAKMRSIESELSVLDRQEGAAKVEIVTPRATTLGDDIVATRVLSQPVGSSTVVERDIFTGPTGTANAQPFISLDTDPGIYGLPTLPTSIVDLLPVIPTSSDVVRYFRQDTFTNAAGTVGQLGASGKSNLTWSAQFAVVSKVAHHMVVSTDALADDPAVAALINRDGVRGVREQIETQLLAANGSSVGSVVSSAQTEEYENGSSVLTAIRKAKTKAELAGLPADFVVVTPQIREAIDLVALPENGGAGVFVGGPNTLFGLRIVTSYRMPEGVNFLVGSTQAVSVRSRQGIEVETSNSHDDYFVKDGVVVKVSAKLALANIRPNAFVKGVEAAPAE